MDKVKVISDIAALKYQLSLLQAEVEKTETSKEDLAVARQNCADTWFRIHYDTDPQRVE